MSVVGVALFVLGIALIWYLLVRGSRAATISKEDFDDAYDLVVRGEAAAEDRKAAWEDFQAGQAAEQERPAGRIGATEVAAFDATDPEHLAAFFGGLASPIDHVMVTAALPALVAQLALDLAPVRVNLIAPGFVDTALSASLLGDDLDQRRDQLRATLPIGRVVGPADVAALAVHIMANTALTGATYDIDGGQQLLS